MTLASDLIAALDGLVGGRVYAEDSVPDSPAFPYITLLMEPFETLPALDGDARVQAWRMLGQVDVWEALAEESPTLRSDVIDRLNGMKLTQPLLRLRLISILRIPELPPVSIVHHALTVHATEITHQRVDSG